YLGLVAPGWWNGPTSSSHGTGIDRNWATVAAPQAAPTCNAASMSSPRSSPCTRPTVNASPAPVASTWLARTASTWSSLEAAYASAPSCPRVTTTHLSRSPDTERTASKIPAGVTSLYCVSDPITTVAGHVVAPGTGGDVTSSADSAATAVPVGYLVTSPP